MSYTFGVRTIHFRFAFLILAACHHETTAATPAIADAAPSTPTPAISSGSAIGDLQPELVSFSSGALTLHGFMWKPAGAGPFPTIVYNHGSEKLPDTKEGQAMFFVRHGFILFVPHRRGQGRSQYVAPYIDDAIDRDAAALTPELVTQSDDVMAAIAYAASLPYVDAKHVAVVGCSFGGIETLFAAERGTGIVAAVDFAGGAMSWARSTALQDRMKLAARNAKVPVFFIQAENDFDTAPSLVLSDEMKRAGKPYRVHVFPPNGTTHEDGHGFCMGGDAPAWGPEVLDFLKVPMGKP